LPHSVFFTFVCVFAGAFLNAGVFVVGTPDVNFARMLLLKGLLLGGFATAIAYCQGKYLSNV